VSIGETSAGSIVAAFERSVVAPIEVWVSSDDGSSWSRTLDGSVAIRLDALTVRDRAVIIAGSIRYGERGLESTPWAAVSQDGGPTWRAGLPINGTGDGRCATVAAIGSTVATLTVSECSGNPIPRWRAYLSADGLAHDESQP
jgi:hypothetical protein